MGDCLKFLPMLCFRFLLVWQIFGQIIKQIVHTFPIDDKKIMQNKI